MKLSLAIALGLTVALVMSATAGPIAWSGSQNIALGFGGYTHEEEPSELYWYLDINSDGQSDYSVVCELHFNWGRETDQGSWYSQLVEENGLDYLLPQPLAYGVEIGEPPATTFDWYEHGSFNAASYTSGASGPFAGEENAYLGIRFEADDGLHYGWIRMSVAGDYPGTTIHDWAWNTTPGQGLWAGQVPEPSTYILFALGGLTMALAARRQIRKRE